MSHRFIDRREEKRSAEANRPKRSRNLSSWFSFSVMVLALLGGVFNIVLNYRTQKLREETRRSQDAFLQAETNSWPLTNFVPYIQFGATSNEIFNLLPKWEVHWSTNSHGLKKGAFTDFLLQDKPPRAFWFERRLLPSNQDA